MQKKIKNNIRISSIVFLLLVVGCSKEKRNFFLEMKQSIDDIKIDSTSYFVKGFSFENEPTKIDNDLYWKISCDKNSLFYMSGFVRGNQDSTCIVPLDCDRNKKESAFKLFDFTNTLKKSWFAFFETTGKTLYGDSIVYNGLQPVKNDTLFNFSFYPFYHFKANDENRYMDYFFVLNVSRRSGIVDITTYTSDNHIIFYVTLFPKQKIVDRRNGMVLL